jgi:hypothetical protein
MHVSTKLCDVSQLVVFLAVLRIRDVYPGSRIKKISGSRISIRIEEFKYLNPKNCF